MCGIFGYSGKKTNTGSLVPEGLKSLEYRGYDSWGIAIKKTDNEIFIKKEIGKIGDATIPDFEAKIGIGHTRWATHGGVTQANAHPHTGCTNDVIIVHNGIVENFRQLKDALLKSGHKFKSETDSEVIAHQIEEFYKKTHDLTAIFYKLKAVLLGMNAVIALFPNEDTIMVYKNGSPIILGRGDDGNYLASDGAAIAPHTKNVYYLEDGETAEITASKITVWDKNDKEKEAKFIEFEYDPESALLGDYPHFMIKEIAEQPQILTRIINNETKTIQKSAESIKKAFGTYLVGCGTASYAALAGTYLFSKIANRHLNFSISSEFSYLLNFIKSDSLIVALSQSGETIDTLSSVKKAKEKNAKLMAITNVKSSSLYRLADINVLLHAGPEKAVASTKAYTAKIAFLYLIAHELNGSLDKGKENLTKAINEQMNVIKNKEVIKKIAQNISKNERIFILGRGVSYAAALEAALKIKEVSYVHAEGFAAGELKHGVIALIEKNTPVIIFNPNDETYDDTLSAAYEVKARGAHVIGISNKNCDVYDDFIKVEDCNDATIIPNVTIAQLLGYYLAISKGLDPDKPRNLAKSVTVK